MSRDRELSFARKLRAERPAGLRALTMIAAAAASLGMGATVAPPTPVTTSAPSEQAPSKFIDEKTRRRRPAPVTNRVTGGRGGLRARVDSRKARRRLIMLMLGVENSGRQWVRARRDLRRHDDGKWLLKQPAWRLQILAVRMGKLAA